MKLTYVITLHFSSLCNAYSVHKQNTGPHKRVAYIHFYCMHLLEEISFNFITHQRQTSNKLIERCVLFMDALLL